MPKHNLIIKPGESPPKHILKILKDFFQEKDITKLERFGGRIQISLTAPFTDRKQQSSKTIIDHEYISFLKSSNNPEDKLQKLTLKQLREISILLEYPISSKETKKEIENGLASFLKSNITWKNISEDN